MGVGGLEFMNRVGCWNGKCVVAGEERRGNIKEKFK